MTQPPKLDRKAEADEVLALYALGVPAGILARDYGMSKASLRKLASTEKVKRPPASDRALLNRIARTERIKSNVDAYPSMSLWPEQEVAA